MKRVEIYVVEGDWQPHQAELRRHGFRYCQDRNRYVYEHVISDLSPEPELRPVERARELGLRCEKEPA